MQNINSEERLAASKEKHPAAKGTGGTVEGHKRQIGSSTSSNDEPGPSDGSHMFVFTNEKAGMKSVDKERANRIIYEMSKNSSYFKQAELQDKKVDVKVTEMKAKLRALDSPRKAQLTRQADRIATEFEEQRELDEVCLVVDMDMFYAAVEIRDRPELANKPVAVGGESMISTTNYHARLKGVRSAMPGFIGRKLCPELVFVKPDYEKYTQVAETIRAIFREYDPRMRSYSLDEAYLNVTQALTNRLRGSVAAPLPPTSATVQTTDGAKQEGLRKPVHACGYARPAAAVSDVEGLSVTEDASHRRRGEELGVTMVTTAGDEEEEDEVAGQEGCGGGGGRLGGGSMEEHRTRLFEAARRMAEEIRGRIKEATKLTASVGIGPNFMLAKIASDWNKPNGQMCIGGDRAEILRFLHDLPVRKIGGVGKVTEKCLKEAIGVVTCGDLFRERAACLHVMTPHTSRWLIKVSLGVGSSDHDVATEQAEAAGAITRKQISKERTFGELCRPTDLLAKCQEICGHLAAEMATKGLEAKTVGLKLKTTKFHVSTLDSTGQAYISSADDLFAVASALLQREIKAAATASPGGKLRLRLMGVKASCFRGQARYPTLPGQGTLDGFLAPTPPTVQDASANGSGIVGPAAEEAVVECVGRGNGSEVGTARGAEEDAEARSVAASSGKGGSSAGCDAQEVSDSSRSGLTAVEDVCVVAAPDGPPGGVVAALRNRRGWETAQVQQRLLGGSSKDSAHCSEEATAAATAAVTAAAAPSVTCPVCWEELGAVSNMALNRHVDACVGVCTVGDGGGYGPGLGRRGVSSVVTKRSGAGGYGPRRSEGVPAGKRAKASGAGIERFLTPRERT